MNSKKKQCHWQCLKSISVLQERRQTGRSGDTCAERGARKVAFGGYGRPGLWTRRANFAPWRAGRTMYATKHPSKLSTWLQRTGSSVKADPADSSVAGESTPGCELARSRLSNCVRWFQRKSSESSVWALDFSWFQPLRILWSEGTKSHALHPFIWIRRSRSHLFQRADSAFRHRHRTSSFIKYSLAVWFHTFRPPSCNRSASIHTFLSQVCKRSSIPRQDVSLSQAGFRWTGAKRFCGTNPSWINSYTYSTVVLQRAYCFATSVRHTYKHLAEWLVYCELELRMIKTRTPHMVQKPLLRDMSRNNVYCILSFLQPHLLSIPSICMLGCIFLARSQNQLNYVCALRSDGRCFRLDIRLYSPIAKKREAPGP